MKQIPTAYEAYVRNCGKKQKDAEDQQLLDEMCKELKEKHEKQKQQTIAYLREQLKKIEV